MIYGYCPEVWHRYNLYRFWTVGSLDVTLQRRKTALRWTNERPFPRWRRKPRLWSRRNFTPMRRRQPFYKLAQTIRSHITYDFNKETQNNQKKVSCKKYRGSSVHSGDKRSDLTSGRYFLLESESPNLRLILEILNLNMIDPEIFWRSINFQIFEKLSQYNAAF